MTHTEFWQGKKVFLTGHTGFKGGWLALWLQMQGATVVGYALPPVGAENLFSLAHVAEKMTSIMGDVTDFAQLFTVLAAHQPEIVIHLAAQSLVRHSYAEPLKTYATNVMGTVNLLEALRRVGSAKAIINVTTDKCYENHESEPGYQETDRLGGYDPYSSSKACAELVTTAYHNSYFGNETGVATVRAGNVIGGGDWANARLVPDIIASCISQQPLVIRYPNAIRPWQHVLEPLSGYLLLAEKLYIAPQIFSGPWNFGSDLADAKTVQWIVNAVSALWGTAIVTVGNEDAQQVHETSVLRLDCSKAKTELKWVPRWNIERALLETVQWYKVCQQQKNMRDFTLSQIESF